MFEFAAYLLTYRFWIIFLASPYKTIDYVTVTFLFSLATKGANRVKHIKKLKRVQNILKLDLLETKVDTFSTLARITAHYN